MLSRKKHVEILISDLFEGRIGHKKINLSFRIVNLSQDFELLKESLTKKKYTLTLPIRSEQEM